MLPEKQFEGFEFYCKKPSLKKVFFDIKMENRPKFLDLKPFRGEKDELREFDLLRAVLLYKTVRDHKSQTKSAITGKIFIL